MATQPITELFATPPPRRAHCQAQPRALEPAGHMGAHQEWKVIQRAKAGDCEALEDLFTPHRQKLFRIAVRVLRNKEDAEDALQDGLLNAYQNLGTFQGQSQFSTWLTRIVLNAALMKRRRERVRFHAPLAETTAGGITFEQLLADVRPTPEQVWARAENELLVAELFLHLAPAIRAAFHLRYVEGLTLAEAAQAAGVTLAAMKTRLFRGRQQMAARFVKRSQRGSATSSRRRDAICQVA